MRVHVLGALEGGEVRAVHGGKTGEHGFGVVTRHTGDFLLLVISIGSGDAETADRLGGEGDYADDTVTLVGVGEHIGRGTGVVGVGRIHVTVVGTGPLGPAGVALGVPVNDLRTVDGLVEGAFQGEGEREAHGDLVVDTQGCLPDLRHLEVGIHTVHGALQGALFRGNVHGVLLGIDGVELFENIFRSGGELAAVGACGELVQAGVAGLDGAVAVILGGKHGEVLEHGSVGRHVGHVHQRQTAGEEAGTAAHLQAAVAEHIPGEAHAGGYLDVGLGPAAGVQMLAAEVQGLDGAVGHKVVVVVQDGVEADAGSELEALRGSPLVLEVQADLVELDTGRRGLVAAVTIGEGHRFGGGAVDEVVHAAEAVVTGTFTHVGVVGELIFVAEAGHELVGAQIGGDVVLDIEYAVVDTVVPGEQLVTCGHVRHQGLLEVTVGQGAGVTFHDVDEGELLRIRTTDVLDVGPGGQELVGQVVAEAAVEVHGNGAHIVLSGVHGVHEGHGVLGQTVLAHTGTLQGIVAAVHGGVEVTGGTVGGRPLLVGSVVVTHGQVMVLGDVPVHAAQDLHVGNVAGVVLPAAGLVAVGLLQVVRHALHVVHGGAGDVVVLIGHAVRGRTPVVDHGRVAGVLEAAEEEQFVLDDGEAHGGTVHGLVVTGGGNLLTVNLVTAELVVLVIHIGGTLHGVGTGLGDGVHAAADEVALTHIERGNHNLHFLDGIHGNRHAAAGKGGGEAEVVVEVGTVNGEVGATAVTAGDVHAVTAVRGQLDDVRDGTVGSGEGLNIRIGDIRGGADTLLTGELGSGGGNHDGAFQHFRRFGYLGVQIKGFCQLQGDIRVSGVLVTQAGEVHLVGTAGTHTLDGITAVGIGDSAVNGTGGFVLCQDGGADNRFTVLVHHAAGKGCRSDLRIGNYARKQTNACEQKAFKSVSHTVCKINIDTSYNFANQNRPAKLLSFFDIRKYNSPFFAHFYTLKIYGKKS